MKLIIGLIAVGISWGQTQPVQRIQCNVTVSSTTTVAVATPCTWLIQDKPFTLASSAVFTFTPTGTANLLLWADGANQIVAGYNTAQGTWTANANGVIYGSSVTTFPTSPYGVYPIATIAYAGSTIGAITSNVPTGMVGRVGTGSDGNVTFARDTDGGSLASISATFDLSGKTSSIPMPIGAGAGPTVNGSIAYDSTNNMYRAGRASAASFFAMAPIALAPTNDHCAKWVVSGSTYVLGTSGVVCGGTQPAYMMDLPIGGTTSAGTPGSSNGWVFSAATGLANAFPNDQTYPASAAFTDTGANSSDLVNWITIPPSYTSGSVTGVYKLTPATAVAQNETAVIGIRTHCMAAGQDLGTAISAVTYTTEVDTTITFTDVSPGLLYNTANMASALNLDGCTAGGTLKIAVRRKSGSDTAAGTVYLYRLTLAFP